MSGLGLETTLPLTGGGGPCRAEGWRIYDYGWGGGGVGGRGMFGDQLASTGNWLAGPPQPRPLKSPSPSLFKDSKPHDNFIVKARVAMAIVGLCSKTRRPRCLVSRQGYGQPLIKYGPCAMVLRQAAGWSGNLTAEDKGIDP